MQEIPLLSLGFGVFLNPGGGGDSALHSKLPSGAWNLSCLPLSIGYIMTCAISLRCEGRGGEWLEWILIVVNPGLILSTWSRFHEALAPY